jgi:Kinesin motor domain
MGPSASILAAVQDEMQGGVIPRAIRSIFDQLNDYTGNSSEDDEESRPVPSFEYCVRVQFLEVYGQEIRDLLATTQQTSTKLSIRDVGLAEPEVVGASEQKVESAEEALLCLTKGMYRRVTGATSMNETSSRSHAIFSLIVEQQIIVDPLDGTPTKARTERRDAGDPLQQRVQARRSKFNFVDLAGSERQKRTNATGQRLKEGININQGLLVLGNVISALGDPKKQGKTFVPYRDSNLTRLLKGSLGGNHKTLMIACVSPAANNMEESLNCLRYANRAKNIQNHAVVNVDATSRLVLELRGKMQLLASDLLKARQGHIEELSLPLDVVEFLASGGDGETLGSQPTTTPFPVKTLSTPYKENMSPSSGNIRSSTEELHRVKAENELYKLKLESFSGGEGEGNDSDALQKAFVARAAEYEREIASLRTQVHSTHEQCYRSGAELPDIETTTFGGDGGLRSSDRTRLSELPKPSRGDSPELNRLRAQMFGSMAQEKNIDAEVEAEEKAVLNLTSKYLRRDGIEDEDGAPTAHDEESAFGDAELAVRLEAEAFELSNSIDAKEELIMKLQASHKKFEVRGRPGRQH